MKLFATDLDGTLVHYNKIEEDTLKQVRRLNESGEIFAVATGRPYNSCTFLKDDYGIKVDYFVLLNGGLIIDKDGKVVHHLGISNEILNSIVDEIKCDDVIIGVETGYKTYGVHGRYEGEMGWEGLEYEDLKNLSHEEFSLISIYYPKKEVEYINKVCTEINEKYGDEIIAFRNTNFIDVVPKGCSKGEGVKYIRNREDIDFNDTYVIGDSYNDIAMFKEGANSFSFPKVEEGIKKEVKHIVNSVGEAIEEYFLK